MLNVAASQRIYLAVEPVDMRKQFNGLWALAADKLREDPFTGSWFVFTNSWHEGWWLHCQPAGSGVNVVKYLARYVSRTAISDERIVSAQDQSVTFRYTDSATQRPAECTLASDEFMRRYLQHVPQPGQHRVRYFGWMHPAAKRRRILVETLLATLIIVRPASEELSWHLRCPHCQALTPVCVAKLPRSRAPPSCSA